MLFMSREHTASEMGGGGIMRVFSLFDGVHGDLWERSCFGNDGRVLSGKFYSVQNSTIIELVKCLNKEIDL